MFKFFSMTNIDNIKTLKFSELNDEDKEVLSKYIKANKMIFFKDEKSKKFIILLHLINPNFINNSSNDYSINRKRRDEYSIKYNKNYPSFFSNLNVIVGIRAKKININELRLFIEELYSIRFVDDTINLKNQFLEKKINPEHEITLKNEISFPLFVYHSIIQKYINKTSIVQFSLNLLESLDYYKNNYDDAKIFSNFLNETFNKDDLIFFLFVRNCIERITNIMFLEKVKDDINIQRKFSYKRNLIDTEIYLNKDLCSEIANNIFGNDEPILYNSFMQKCGEGVNAYQLLKFSLEDYHESRKNYNSIHSIDYNNINKNNHIFLNSNTLSNYMTYKISRISSLKDNKSYSYSPSNQDIKIIIHSEKNIYKQLIDKYENKWNLEFRNNTLIEFFSEYFKKKILIELFDSIFSNLSNEVKNSFNFGEKTKKIKELISQKYSYLLNCLINNDFNNWIKFLNIKENNISAHTHYNYILEMIKSIKSFKNIKDITEDFLEDFSKNILTTEEFMSQIMTLIEKKF